MSFLSRFRMDLARVPEPQESTLTDAFADTSPRQQASIRDHAFITSRDIQKRFAEITGFSETLRQALLLSPQEFEARFIPPFERLYESRYQHNPDAFIQLVSACAEEFVHIKKQMPPGDENRNRGYFPYIDTFAPKVLRRVGLTGAFLE